MRYVVRSRWTVLVWAALGACGGEPSAMKPAEAPALAARAPVDRRTVAQGRVEEIGSLAVGDRLRGLDAPLVCGPFGWPAATGFACDCVPVYYDSASEVGAPRGAKPTMTDDQGDLSYCLHSTECGRPDGPCEDGDEWPGAGASRVDRGF